jgi:hypothetical protein
LLKREMIIADFFKFCLRLNQNTMFINIIHCSSEPTFLIVCKNEIVSLAMRHRIAGLLNRGFDPDIIKVICIGVTNNEGNIITGSSIRNSESYLRLKTCLPLMLRNGNIFFKNIDGGKTRGKEQGTKNKEQGTITKKR